tara:strand:- start:67676 stop:69007 length:1332 start_codon:yes stop_codon:yes gene_type:complete
MKKSLFLMLCSLISLSGFSQNSAEDVQTITLENGMKILVLEDHSIPNANMYLFWKVGSRNEYPGITGLSHFFEHMMFNGAKKYGPKEFDPVMEANGGSNNAYTTSDLTVYTDWFPSSAVEIIFDLEADRIGHLSIDPDMVESERGVVLSERRTGLENSNYRAISAQVDAAAYFAHPYKWPVIGYESDIKAWTKEDLEEYFRTYYAPNNALVVIAGDVTLESIEALAMEYFEPIPAQKPPREVRTVEPPQQGEKRVYVEKQVSSPNLMIAWHAPETSHEDYYALDILSNILTSGNSARLNRSLIFENQLAVGVYALYSTSLDPTLFKIYAIAGGGVTAETVEEAIYEQLNDIIENGITEEELQKVKNQKLMEFYGQIETINGKANNIGTYELYFGDYKKLFTAPDDYQKVSVEDIQRVVESYFTKKNRTVGILQSPETTENEAQ